MFPEEKSSRKQASWVLVVQVKVIHEFRLLTFLPFPHVQLIESKVTTVLDSNQEVFITVSMNANGTSGIFGLPWASMVGSGIFKKCVNWSCTFIFKTMFTLFSIDIIWWYSQRMSAEVERTKLFRSLWLRLVWKSAEGNVHIFWEGHEILRNFQFTFDWHYIGQK